MMTAENLDLIVKVLISIALVSIGFTLMWGAQRLDDLADAYRSLTTAVLGPECRVCGCTNDEACVGGCSWAEPDLCSVCAALVPPPPRPIPGRSTGGWRFK